MTEPISSSGHPFPLTLRVSAEGRRKNAEGGMAPVQPAVFILHSAFLLLGPGTLSSGEGRVRGYAHAAGNTEPDIMIELTFDATMGHHAAGNIDPDISEGEWGSRRFHGLRISEASPARTVEKGRAGHRESRFFAVFGGMRGTASPAARVNLRSLTGVSREGRGRFGGIGGQNQGSPPQLFRAGVAT